MTASLMAVSSVLVHAPRGPVCPPWGRPPPGRPLGYAPLPFGVRRWHDWRSEPKPRVAKIETPMLHIAKLAVGVRDIDHIRALQAERMRTTPPLRHRTRNFPRRGNEVLDGGSLYWVISGSMLARQRILDIVEDTRDDQTKCTS